METAVVFHSAVLCSSNANETTSSGSGDRSSMMLIGITKAVAALQGRSPATEAAAKPGRVGLHARWMRWYVVDALLRALRALWFFQGHLGISWLFPLQKPSNRMDPSFNKLVQLVDVCGPYHEFPKGWYVVLK